MKKYILALDQGTTSSRAVVFEKSGEIIGIKSRPLTQFYPKPGWVEHDALEIWQQQMEAAREVISASGAKPEEIGAIGITNQRETVVIWDRETGRPIHNAIVWQCRRTSDICTGLKNQGAADIVKQKTGLVIDAYFSGTKIKWLLDNIPGARDLAGQGRLLAGTMDTWLIWNLTGGKRHVSDYSNASRTMLFNIKSLGWDEEILKMLDIPGNMLPEVVRSSGIIAETVPELFGIRIPISGAAGDQQSALFGQACFEPGCAKNTYGTGCFILMNTGKKPVNSEHNLLTTIAWDIGQGVEYALEGSVFNAGSSIQWLRDEMKLINSAPEGDLIAARIPDTNGVYVVPAFTGLGAPYWDMYARGAIVGLTRGANKEHIVRATLESIAYQSMDVFMAMQSDSGVTLKELKVDGGASNSDFLMQFQSDMLGIDVIKPTTSEITALGAACLAGLGVGFWEDRKAIADNWKISKIYKPKMPKDRTALLYDGWKKAVQRAMAWSET